MFLRKQGFLAEAFEQTYRRSIAESSDYPSAPFYSILSGLLGWQYKYYQSGVTHLRNEKGRFIELDTVSRFKDRNIYNWIEQIVFLPGRLLKNIAKLFTEFVWNAATAGLTQASNYLKQLGDENFSKVRDPQVVDYFKYWISHAAGSVLKGLSAFPWLLSKIGQTITSPFIAAKETAAYVREKTGSKFLGGLAAALRFSFTIAAYAIIGGFALPALAPALGGQVAGFFSTVINAISSTPVIGPVLSTIGSGFLSAISAVASFLGISAPATALASSIVAGSAIIATPVLSLLKAGLRRISPIKGLPEAPYAGMVPVNNSAIHCGLSEAAPQLSLSAAASSSLTSEAYAAPKKKGCNNFVHTISSPFKSAASWFASKCSTNKMIRASKQDEQQQAKQRMHEVPSWRI